MTIEAFDTKKMDEYTAQAKANWRDTAAYREYEQKSEGRSDEDNRLLGGQMMEIFAEFGSIRDSDPASDAAQSLVKTLQGFISKHYYTCTKDILRGLGQMYAGGGDMTANIDRFGGEGTAEFAAAAIQIYCR